MDDKESKKMTHDRIKESAPAYQTRSADSYTIEDYLALPDDVRAELIDGRLIYMEAPSTLHQYFLTELTVSLHNFIRSNKRKCTVLFAPLDVQLDCDDKTMVQPDVMVICTRDKITRNRIYGAPELCIEVTSPSTRSHDMKTKLRKYKDAGVREYWIVDIDRKQVICHFFEKHASPSIYSFETPVPVQIFECKLTIDFAEILNSFLF